MITQELITYIKSQIVLGTPKDQIINILKSTGWMDIDIHEAFDAIIPPEVTSAPVSEPAPMVFNPVVSEPVTPVVIPVEIKPEPMVTPIMVQPVVVQQPVQQVMAQEMSVMTQPVQPIIQPVQTMPVQPVVMQASAPVQPTYVQSEPMHSKKPLWLAIAAVVVILLGAGAAYAYQLGFFTPLSQVTSGAFESMYLAKTASFDMTATVDFSGMKKTENPSLSFLPDGIGSSKLSITTKGQYDMNDETKPSFTSNFALDAGAVTANVDALASNSSLYVRLVKAPTIALVPFLSKLENKWIAFPDSQTSEQSSTLPFIGMAGVDASILNTLTADQKLELYAITRNAHFVNVTKKLNAETINGNRSYHFMFDLDTAGIAQYMKDVKEYINRIGKSDSKLSAFDPTSYAKDLENLKDFSGEAWIGQKDKLLYKVAMNFSIADVMGSDSGSIKVGLVGVFDKWNEPVSISTPTESITFEQVMEELFSDDSMNVLYGAENSPSLKAEEARKRSIVTNTQSSAELFASSHNNQYAGFCKSDVQNPVVYSCIDAKTAYSAFVLLSNGKYFCADSKGYVGEIDTKPTGTLCPTAKKPATLPVM